MDGLLYENNGVLPEDMETGTACFFTGHRFLSPVQIKRMYPALVRGILQAAEEGCRYFISGGAMGFDLLAARTILLLRQEFRRDIHLVLALPCRNQTERWLYGKRGMENIRQYSEIKALAGTVVYMQDFYTTGCMKVRNQYMADHAGRCIAFWSGTKRGGTYQTVRIAQKAGIPVWNLYPAVLDDGEAGYLPEA